MKQYFKIILQWGLIGGMSMTVLRMLFYFIAPLSTGKWENIFYLPLLFCMVWGAVTVKRSQGGEITFGKAFGIIFLVAFIGCIINSLAAVALIKWVDPELGETILNKAMENAEEGWEKAGLTEEQMEKSRWWVELFFRTPVMLIASIIWQSFIGAIISLVISAFVKRTVHSESSVGQTPLN